MIVIRLKRIYDRKVCAIRFVLPIIPSGFMYFILYIVFIIWNTLKWSHKRQTSCSCVEEWNLYILFIIHWGVTVLNDTSITIKSNKSLLFNHMYIGTFMWSNIARCILRFLLSYNTRPYIIPNRGISISSVL